MADVLRELSPLLARLTRHGVGARWYVYLEMFDDYRRLCGEGHKRMYVIAYLCDVYGMSQSQIYLILARLRAAW